MTSVTALDGNNTASEPSIYVDHRTSRSVLTAVLQTGLRRFKKHLFSYQEQPEGSPELTVPHSLHEHCTVHERIVQGIRLYDINVRAKSTDQYVAFTREHRGDPNHPDPARIHKHKHSSSHDDQAAAAPPPHNSEPLPAYISQDTSGLPNGSTSHPFSLSTASLTREDHPADEVAYIESDHDDDDAPPAAANTSKALNETTSVLQPIRTKTRDFAHKASPTRPRPRQIYYFAGGSWNMPPTKDHWRLCAHLALKLTKNGTPTTVTVVSYPLAPNTPAVTAFPLLEKAYYELFSPVSIAAPDPENKENYIPVDTQIPEVILAGDSSGGNVALALTLHMLCKHGDAPAPDSLLLISPTVKMDADNPLIPSIERHDPILTHAQIKGTHAGWTAAAPNSSEPVFGASDPRVSPLFGDLQELKRRGVRVNGVNAGYDILGADVRDFVTKLKEVGVTGRWLEWDKMFHVFPLTFSYKVPEGIAGVKWIMDTIELERKNEKAQDWGLGGGMWEG